MRVCVFFVRTKETFWYQNCLCLLIFYLFFFMLLFLFCLLTSTFPCSNREVSFLNLIRDGVWEKESTTDVQCRQENPNPRVHRSSGKLGKPRFPLEWWTLGLGFSCPHWTPMMDSISTVCKKNWSSLVMYSGWDSVLLLETTCGWAWRIFDRWLLSEAEATSPKYRLLSPAMTFHTLAI